MSIEFLRPAIEIWMVVVDVLVEGISSIPGVGGHDEFIPDFVIDRVGDIKSIAVLIHFSKAPGFLQVVPEGELHSVFVRRIELEKDFVGLS